MRFGFALRLMGEAAQADVLRKSAQQAEAAGLDTLWVPDHVAIPPDQTEGSGGRYFDPLSSLSWLAAVTTKIGLGTAALVLPYRPALPTAKAVATIQELSGGRLSLGVGIGWMQAEFDALGVDSSARGRISNETLAFLNDAFDAPNDEIVANGQAFVFRPRPPKPRILVGGGAPHALARAARFADGWMPMSSHPGKLAQPIRELRSRFEEAGRGKPEVVAFGALGHESEASDLELLDELAELGVTEFIQGARYEDLDGFSRSLTPFAQRLAIYRNRTKA